MTLWDSRGGGARVDKRNSGPTFNTSAAAAISLVPSAQNIKERERELGYFDRAGNWARSGKFYSNGLSLSGVEMGYFTLSLSLSCLAVLIMISVR